jgi:hypothetical protein
LIRAGVFVALIFISTNAFAWGKRGHAIVCQTAAALLHDRSPLMKSHAFDLGYYCNVPDLVWKKPATYSVEAPQHFMDLEVFSRAFAKRPLPGDPFLKSRGEFEKAYPEIPLNAGRSYWRIRELMDSLGETSAAIREFDKGNVDKSEVRANYQEKWLVTAGAIGHYVGDLSQPLHVTEDYDGQHEPGQGGIHSWFEDAVVNELAGSDHPGRLESEVGELALKKWKTFDASKKSVLDLLKAEANESLAQKDELLRIDKHVGRKQISKASEAYLKMISERLAAGAVTLAELWSRELNWKYQGEKFYNFAGTPEYMAPPATAPKADPTPKP